MSHPYIMELGSDDPLIRAGNVTGGRAPVEKKFPLLGSDDLLIRAANVT